MSPLFFLSYSSIPGGKFVQAFYDDLAQAVIDRSSVAKAEDAGFYDRGDVHLGDSWKGKLTDALNSCSVFVYIHSEPYFRKANTFCGKEWWIFRGRVESWKNESNPPKQHAPLMLPVLWMPEGIVKNIPASAANDIQYKHRDLGDFYADNGLLALMERKDTNPRFGDAYRQLIARLSQRIIDVARDYPLPVSQQAIPPFDQVPSAFESQPPPDRGGGGGGTPLEGEGPRYAVFAFVAGTRAELEDAQILAPLAAYGANGGDDWKPFRKRIAPWYAQHAASSGEWDLICQWVKLSRNLVADLQKADDANKIVVVVVDTWSLHLPDCKSQMSTLDRNLFKEYSIVVPWHEDQETSSKADVLRTLLEETFPRQRKQSQFRGDIRSEDALLDSFRAAFQAGLGKALGKIYRKAEGDGYSLDYVSKPVINASGVGEATTVATPEG